MRFLLILFLTLNLLQAKKIALLIGNSDYNFAPLANPLNDVDGIYQTLKEIGFDIVYDRDVLKNASKTEMEKALLNFEEKAQSAEIALIYFSGHGMQVNNINYMFPAKTTVTKPIHLKKLVDLEMFIQSATSAKYGIILVDACRDNPLVKYFQNGKYKGANAKKGLGQVTPKSGQVVIGFATSAGDTADDGNGDMSPYAKALSKRLKTPNKDITKILGLVALDVSAKYNQNPIYRANLAYNVILNENQTNEIVTIDGLMYQNIPFRHIYSWYEAKKYCQEVTFKGYNNWRLPNVKELSKIATIAIPKESLIIDKKLPYTLMELKEKYKNKRNQNLYNEYLVMKKEFVNNLVSNTYFWTSESSSSYTNNKSATNNYVFLDFLYGIYGHGGRGALANVLCVRDIK